MWLSEHKAMSRKRNFKRRSKGLHPLVTPQTHEEPNLERKVNVKKLIAETDYYKIEVDKTKNRVYYTIIGFWKSPSIVPNYLEDTQKAVNEVSPGFNIVTDATQMKIPPKEVGKIHEKAQKILVDGGLNKTAEVLPKSLVKMTLNKYAQKSQMKKQNFETIEEAVAWLDKNI
jgi:hypothetical protein